KIRTLRLPDVFQDHDSPDKQYDAAGLTAPHIVQTALSALRWNEPPAPLLQPDRDQDLATNEAHA
ncbi:hypothetical protein NL473_29870, partial [Klebsiella pneumoniae]|nr:hypothetical protein [Klebsiella pneumoniae]MCP6594831.1 hypothetical protein [Klebsiella pneumoniae]